MYFLDRCYGRTVSRVCLPIGGRRFVTARCSTDCVVENDVLVCSTSLHVVVEPCLVTERALWDYYSVCTLCSDLVVNSNLTVCAVLWVYLQHSMIEGIVSTVHDVDVHLVSIYLLVECKSDNVDRLYLRLVCRVWSSREHRLWSSEHCVLHLYIPFVGVYSVALTHVEHTVLKHHGIFTRSSDGILKVDRETVNDIFYLTVSNLVLIYVEDVSELVFTTCRTDSHCVSVSVWLCRAVDYAEFVNSRAYEWRSSKWIVLVLA